MNRESTTLPGAAWMLGSFALGAIAMFLSDPEQGRRRRAMASDKLQSAADSTSRYVSAATQDLGHRAQDLRAMATDKLQNAADSASRYVGSAAQNVESRGQDAQAMAASGTLQSVADSARRYIGAATQELGSRAQDMRDRMGHSVPDQRFGQPYSLSDRDLQTLVNRELWMLGGVALGALAMFLADPQMGRRRRALANDKFRSAAISTRKYMESTSRDLSNRAQGLRAEARRMLRTSEQQHASDASTIH